MPESTIKESFLKWLQLAAWILSVLGTFLIEPPFSLPDQQKFVAGFTKFFLAVFLGLLLYPLNKYKKAEYTRRWWIAGIVLFFSAMIMTAGYLTTYQEKTILHQVNDMTYLRLVVGNRLTADGDTARVEVLKQKAVATNEDIVTNFSIQTVEDLKQVWEPEGIRFNNYLLLGFYLLLIFSCSALLMIALQVIKAVDAPPKPDTPAAATPPADGQ